MEVKITYLDYQPEIFFQTTERYVIFTKGRRTGATRGYAHASIEYCLDDIGPILWVDTVNGNIDRYVERYFLPILEKMPPEVRWQWNQQKKLLKIANQYIDFRSAEHPETIEGFAYKKIFLNEAGIILKDDYLYQNAILPMMLDYPDAQLIAAGVPKGKIKKDGSKHKFYELYENCINKKKGYKLFNYSTYTNPNISDEDIDDLTSNMSASEIRQEIYGEFIDMAGQNPFAYNFIKENHLGKVYLRPDRQLLISIDFNLNPFGCIFAHAWTDLEGEHCHIFDEFSIPNGSIDRMIDEIKAKYGNYLHNCFITGDSMGNRGSIEQRDNATLYMQLQRGLGLNNKQIQVPQNPTHDNSRANTNLILKKFKDFKINPDTCKSTVIDIQSVQCDAFGQIIKKNRNDVSQRADHLDCVRYLINTFLHGWIKSQLKK